MLNHLESSRQPYVIFDAPKGEVKFNPKGLSIEHQKIVQQIALDTFKSIPENSSYVLRRCNWFVDTAYPTLKQLCDHHPDLRDPRIVGCDFNPFDQHYWLEVDIVSDAGNQTAIIDPIFGYVGLKEEAVRGNSYYRNEKTRVVPHGLSREDGGVRVNTMSI